MFWAKYGEAVSIRFPLIKRGVVDFAATGDFTPATGDTKISKDGGNVANTTNNPSAVGGTGSIEWTLTLTGLEMQCYEAKVQIVDSATKAIEDQDLLIQTYGHPNAKDPRDWDVIQAPRPATSIPSTSFAADTTAHAVDMPTNVQAGDLLLVFFANDGSATVTTPTGWTLLSSDANGSAVRLSIYAKKALGTEGGTTVDFVTSATEYAAAFVHRYAAGTWYGDIATGVKVGTAATGTSTTPDPPAVVCPWGMINSHFTTVLAKDEGTNTITLYPTSYTDQQSVATGNAAGVVISNVRRSDVPDSTGSEDPGTWTITSEEWVCQTVAIRPATTAVVHAATANQIADHARRRTQANVEASNDGDTLSLGSEYGMMQQVQESDTTTTPGTLTVYKTDGSTVLGTKTVDSDPAADPIVGIS